MVVVGVGGGGFFFCVYCGIFVCLFVGDSVCFDLW